MSEDEDGFDSQTQSADPEYHAWAMNDDFISEDIDNYELGDSAFQAGRVAERRKLEAQPRVAMYECDNCKHWFHAPPPTECDCDTGARAFTELYLRIESRGGQPCPTK